MGKPVVERILQLQGLYRIGQGITPLTLDVPWALPISLHVLLIYRRLQVRYGTIVLAEAAHRLNVTRVDWRWTKLKESEYVPAGSTPDVPRLATVPRV